MKTLIIDASTKFLYISFYEDDEEIYQYIGVGKNNHSENLITSIKAGLEESKIEMRDFRRIIVGIGPGSYTGLRVALTVAKTLAWTLDIPLYSASSLDMLASGYLKTDGLYAISSKAKKDHVYGKLIEVIDGKQKVIIDDSFFEVGEYYKKLAVFNYFEINDNNYLFNPNNIKIELVRSLHSLTPNYLRKEI